MLSTSTGRALAISGVLAIAATSAVGAQEIIKLGLSVQLSGAAANWGKGADLMCKQAAEEISAAGGVKVGDKSYNFECLTYDNKYTAAEGTKVAQTLLNRDGVKFIGGSMGTAPVQALQTLTERQGVLLFTAAWGASLKGEKFPLTFTQLNTPREILPLLTSYVVKEHPEAKTVFIMNPNDASGQETVKVAETVWKGNGINILAMDFYERGTTEFQPIAARIVAMKPDIVDLGTMPPADAGALFREIAALGWSGVKVVAVGTGVDALKATGGDAIEGVYMGLAATFDGPSASEHQRKVNEQIRGQIGESLNTLHISFYDTLFALKAAMEKAQSIEPKDVAAAMPQITFPSFYDIQVSFGGTETYGTAQQMLLPVFVTQVKDGALVELAKIEAK